MFPVAVILYCKDEAISSSSGLVFSAAPHATPPMHRSLLLVPMGSLWPYLASSICPPIHRLQDDVRIKAMHGNTSFPVKSNQDITHICCNQAAKVLASIITPRSEWSFDHVIPDSTASHSVDLSLLLFDIHVPQDFAPTVSFPLNSDVSHESHPGQAIQIIGSPFAHLSPSHFTNCTFTACISCLVGDKLIWIDTSAEYPGMEGSLVIDSSGDQVLGILLSPLTRKGDQARINLAVSFNEISQELIKLLGIRNERSGPRLESIQCHNGSSAAVMSEAAECVCLIVVEGRRWASGIIASVENGILLTVAHLFKGGEERQKQPILRVRVGNHKIGNHNQWMKARVLFIFKSHDLAVIQVEDQSLQQREVQIKCLALCEKVLEGAECFSCGFGLLGETPLQVSPRFTQGNIVKIVQRRGTGSSSMLITSCSVHSGASGGALMAFDPTRKEMKLLGMVTSNTKLSNGTGTRILPRLSYAIPSRTLAPLFHLIAREKGMRLLDRLTSLDVEDAASDQIWNLEGQARSKL